MNRELTCRVAASFNKRMQLDFGELPLPSAADAGVMRPK